MKVVVIEPIGVLKEKAGQIAKNILGDKADLFFYSDRAETDAGLIERVRDAEVVVVSNQPLKRVVLENCPKLKFISVAFTGVDHVDLEHCRKNNIPVSNCAGYATAAVSDLTFGLLIALYRRLVASDQAVRNGRDKTGLIGFELEGKTFGVVGLGAIGLKVAHIAAAFGCRVLGYSRVAKDVPGVKAVSFGELLKESDIVSLHLPLTDSTKGLIGPNELNLMKSSAVLINTARGPIVDSAALFEALNSGRLAGAALDVFDSEPPLNTAFPILKAPNTVLAPHVGFATHEALEKRAQMVFQNVRHWLMGAPINLV